MGAVLPAVGRQLILSYGRFTRTTLVRTEHAEMKTVQGDLLQMALRGDFDVIVHGCNCFNTMGAGIAKFVKATFPEAYEADLATAKGERGKLGSYSSATVEREGRRLTVVNAYTQFHYRGRKPLVDYEALSQVFHAIGRDFAGQRIGYPKIGAGLAGGDWERISRLIDDALEGAEHTLVEFA